MTNDSAKGNTRKGPRTEGRKNKKHGKNAKDGKGKNTLAEQVLSIGGDTSDLKLLKGIRADEQHTAGHQIVDPELTKDVTKFLKGLTSAPKTDNNPHPKKQKPKATPATQAKEKKGRSEVTLDTRTIKEKSQKKTEKTQHHRKGKSANEEDTKTVEETKPPLALPPISKNNTKLVFPPSPHWYSAVAPLAPTSSSLSAPSAVQISSLTDRAAQILRTDSELYQSSAASTGHSASDSHFLNAILAKGTLSDRLSALTLLVQASPVHNVKALETLKGMAERGRGKGGRDEGLKAMRCVVDWWIGGGAPGRKLRYFRDQPLVLHPLVTDQHLVMWYFEDWLKKYFFSILQILETYSLDTLPYVRTQALGFISTFLREKPEQEQNLLRLLVNKLGDTEKSVCSRASYHILQLLQSHPNMKAVIVREIRSLIFRPAASTSASIHEAEREKKANSHIRFAGDEESKSTTTKAKGRAPSASSKGQTMERWNTHAWYYAAVTLNQVVLTPSEHDREVARSLVEVYFEMFREVLGGAMSGKDDEAKPDAEVDVEEGAEKSSTGGKKAKGKEKAIRGAAGFTEVEDENSRLISAVLTGVNRALPFAKVDMGSGNEMFKKHIDTLFLITHTSTFNISLQALMLILQVITTFSANAPSTSKAEGNSYASALADRFYRTLYASLSDPRLSKSNKQAMYLNLLFKALKADTNLERVKAFIRRFVQILVVGVGGGGGMEFVAGGLYLLGELFGTIPGLRDMMNDSSTTRINEGEDYDPRKRDPQYAHASASPLYELLPLLHHYHPTISLHARQLLSGMPLTATADLSLNTLSHFLDRFVYKNPKKPKTKGASAMQPAASGVDGASGVKLLKGEATRAGGPVNEVEWWKRKAENVAVDEVFFHKYFTRKNEQEQEKAAKIGKRKGHGGESDEDMESDDEDGDGEDEEGMEETVGDDGEEDSDRQEAEIWKAMKSTMPSELQDDDLMEDTDDMSSDLDDELSEEEEEQSKAESRSNEKDDGEDDAISLAEASDAEDLLSLDADIPDGLIDYEGSEAGEDDDDDAEWGGIDDGLNVKKRKRSVEEDKGKDGKSRRKKLRSLPTFASYEDYAKLIEDAPEDNL